MIADEECIPETSAQLQPDASNTTTTTATPTLELIQSDSVQKRAYTNLDKRPPQLILQHSNHDNLGIKVRAQQNKPFTENEVTLNSEPISLMTPTRLARKPSLSRPERAKKSRSKYIRELLSNSSDESGCNLWRGFSRMITFYAPDSALEKCGGMHNDNIKQAWREKMALVTICFSMCVILGFITFGFTRTICTRNEIVYRHSQVVDYTPSEHKGTFVINGELVRLDEYASEHTRQLDANYPGLALEIDSVSGVDISRHFPVMSSACQDFTQLVPAACISSEFPINYCHDMSKESMRDNISRQKLGKVVYEWSEIQDTNNVLIVFKERVLNVREFLTSTQAQFDPWTFEAIRRNVGRDMSKLFASNSTRLKIGHCLTSLYAVGSVDEEPFGCIVSYTVLYTGLVAILSVVLLRFFLAIWFSYFISKELGRLKSLKAKSKSPGKSKSTASPRKQPPSIRSGSPFASAYLNNHESEYTEELYTIMLVTCYSEGEEGLRNTMDSLAKTLYNDDYKLLFMVADGMITGSGNSKTTPDIILDMIELDPDWGDPPPMSYLAIADGSKRHNMAKVYAGWYINQEHSVPTIVVVKCGTPQEEKNSKPGNRGKRDSQMILMNFLHRVMFDEKMSPLDFDMFIKIRTLMGVTPDLFQIVLMVDADTKVADDSLSRMVACMARDPMVMGLCGETRIANKTESWVSRIQVFEYFMSHHLNKAFESIFGGVTCLPGCFCMYRIKAPKADKTWVPILANPDIIATYSENVVETLHQKNLLLLGEDRFLTTLMLKTFPHRKLIFVPRAYCKTTVPAEFSVLLSQRRRWINSTIHNLFELALVRELCGTFCLSMQAIIILELVGTVTLPAAITFTLYISHFVVNRRYLVISSAIGTPEPIPLGLLAAILGLPAVLIMLTSRRFIYVYWMFVYLLALPIWNFILPSYAFWHFDDFSWGETRKVEGEKNDRGHGGSDGKKIDVDEVPLKKWIDWTKLAGNRNIRSENE